MNALRTLQASSHENKCRYESYLSTRFCGTRFWLYLHHLQSLFITVKCKAIPRFGDSLFSVPAATLWKHFRLVLVRAAWQPTLHHQHLLYITCIPLPSVQYNIAPELKVDRLALSNQTYQELSIPSLRTTAIKLFRFVKGKIVLLIWNSSLLINSPTSPDSPIPPCLLSRSSTYCLPRSHLAVLGHLNYESLLKLSATIRYFRQLRFDNRRIVVGALLDLERRASAGDVCPALSPQPCRGSLFFPCYRCLKILEHLRFKKNDCNLRKPAGEDDLVGRRSQWLRKMHDT